MKTRLILTALFLACLLPPVLAQNIEDPGPRPVGWSDVQFQDQYFGCGTVKGRVYYPALSAGNNTPADPASGPYPLVAFEHGWLGRPSNYDNLCTHISSWGFVVASIGTETGFFATMQAEALDTQALLYWMRDESNTPGSPYFDLLDDGDWSAIGHSMGGGSVLYLMGYEPKIRTVIPLQPHRGPGVGGSGGSAGYLAAYDGSILFIAGDKDTACPWSSTTRPYFIAAENAARNFAFLVHGMGHLGPCDEPSPNEPLPPEEQHRIHRRLVTGFLRTEVKGEEDLFVDILGEGIAPEPVTLRSRTIDPPFWAVASVPNPGNIAVGLAGKEGIRALLAWSTAPANIQTPYGILGLDLSVGLCFFDFPLGETGTTEQLLPVQPSWIGLPLYLQGAIRRGSQGVLTRTAIVIP